MALAMILFNIFTNNLGEEEANMLLTSEWLLIWEEIQSLRTDNNATGPSGVRNIIRRYKRCKLEKCKTMDFSTAERHLWKGL